MYKYVIKNQFYQFHIQINLTEEENEMQYKIIRRSKIFKQKNNQQTSDL